MALARVQSDAPDRTVTAVVAELLDTVATLATWFGEPHPQAQRLRRQMRDAVAPVLRSHRTLLAVGGTVSRRAELLKLAHAVEDAPNSDQAWRLWATATGLWSARHLRLETPDVADPPHTSTWEAPPAAVSSRLRRQGHRSLTGRTARMSDTSAARAEARRQAARDRADLARAETGLVARSGTRLTDWGPLESAQADLFLQLVATARNHRDSDGRLSGRTPDGRWQLVLTPVDPPCFAVLHTPDGRLVLPDAHAEFSP